MEDDLFLEFVDKISGVDESRMQKDLVAYEAEHGIDVNYKTFSLVCKNSKGIILGILSAYTAFSEIYVDDIWVDSVYRRQGIGQKMLEALENHFKGKGYNNINLVTSAFQAPEFYLKCGFTSEFVRKNKVNPKLSKTFFVKFFEDQQQTQGLKKTSEKKSKPLIIGFSGITGSGKTTLVKALSKKLEATAIHWDDFDDISKSPEDYVKWYHGSRDYSEWEYPELAKVLKQLKHGNEVVSPATKEKLIPTDIILFDAPIGYCHKETGQFIDFLVNVDTPLDVALARRLLRLNKDEIPKELMFYLEQSRPLYIQTEPERQADMVVDGSMPLEMLVDHVEKEIQKL
jgi:uridine kinase/GNAT superfamily N-acetyltransferase